MTMASVITTRGGERVIKLCHIDSDIYESLEDFAKKKDMSRNQAINVLLGSALHAEKILSGSQSDHQNDQQSDPQIPRGSRA